MLILRTTDIVPCKIEKVTLWISPLSWAQKSNLLKFSRIQGGEDKTDETQMLFETLRLAVKKVDGLASFKFSDGSEASVQWDESGELTRESLEMLIRLIGITPISHISSAILTDAIDKDIDGWQIDLGKVEDTAKKK